MYQRTREQQMGFLPALFAIGQTAASGYAGSTVAKAQSKVVKAQTALENVRARASEIAAQNKLVMFGVGGALALGALVFALRRK